MPPGDGASIFPALPLALPPPRSPVGLQRIRIPAFQPKEAKRAAWAKKGRKFAPDGFVQIMQAGDKDMLEAREHEKNTLEAREHENSTLFKPERAPRK